MYFKIAAVTALLVLTLMLGLAWAANGEGSQISLGAYLFIGLLALIVLVQFIPGLLLFGGMLMALFGKEKQKAAPMAKVQGK
jgi:hypothetical protein